MAQHVPSAPSPIPGVALVVLPPDDAAFREYVQEAARSLGGRATGADLQAALRARYPAARVLPVGPLRPVRPNAEAVRYVYRDDAIGA